MSVAAEAHVERQAGPREEVGPGVQVALAMAELDPAASRISVVSTAGAAAEPACVGLDTAAHALALGSKPAAVEVHAPEVTISGTSAGALGVVLESGCRLEAARRASDVNAAGAGLNPAAPEAAETSSSSQ